MKINVNIAMGFYNLVESMVILLNINVLNVIKKHGENNMKIEEIYVKDLNAIRKYVGEKMEAGLIPHLLYIELYL